MTTETNISTKIIMNERQLERRWFWKNGFSPLSTPVYCDYDNGPLGQKVYQIRDPANEMTEGYIRGGTHQIMEKKSIPVFRKNTELLFGSSAQRQPNDYQTDNIVRGGSASLTLGKTKIKNTMCLISLLWNKKFTKEEQSCATMATVDIDLAPNHQYQTSNNATTIPLETTLLICKKDIEDYSGIMQSYTASYQGQSNDKATMNVMVHRLSKKLDRESKRWSNGLLKLGISSNKGKKDTSSATSSSSSSSSPSTTPTTSTPSTPFDYTELSTTMQFQPSYHLPFATALAKKDWNTSSIYSQLQQQQDMKSKIEALEQKLKHDHLVFEKQRTILLEEIKMKEKQLLEKEQQWETRWSAKTQKLQQQLETERKNHEDDICEWKTRYQAAMDTEQQKHYRRLAYFHERLTAKNIEYAELEKLLARSAPVSPVTSPMDSKGLKPVSKMTNGENDDTLSLSTLTNVDNNDDYYATHPQHHPSYRWRRSSSLDAGASPRTRTNTLQATQSTIADPVIEKGRLELAVARHPSNTRKGNIGSSSPLPLMDDLYACELQDMTLRHQASVDNMAAEYEVNRVELLEQHDRDRELWKLEHDSELQNARMQLMQDHERRMDQVNKNWQQKWDDMVAQNKRVQAELQKQWDLKSTSDKLAWDDCKSREHDALKKQLGWSTYELDLMLKEHKTTTILAKQLNLAIDPSTDVEDMKLTLVGLLETGIQNASRLDSLRCHSEKSNEPAPLFGLWNLSF